MDDATFNRLYSNYQATAQPPTQAAKPRGNAIKSLLASFLPTIGGTIGAVGGSLITPIAGTAAGGAGGAALGEALRQRITGEKTNLKKIGVESALGAVPGVLSGAKTALTGGRAVEDAVAAERALQAGEGAATAARSTEAAPSLLSKMRSQVTSAGTDLREGVANPQVRAGVGAAEKEAQIGARVSQVPGLSAKGKYANLQSEMDALSAKIEPQLSKAKGTVNSSDLITGIRTNAEQSSHFLAGDPAYEKQLGAVLADLSAKTGGAEKLTAQQLYDYKKGMDVSSIFTKLEKGADLNPKEAARLSVWSSLDDGITKAAPGVKDLTKEQSLLIQGAPGLKKNAVKTMGVPILGIKSQKAEQIAQAGRELLGRGLEAVGGDGTVKAPTLLGKVTKAGAAQIGTRALAAPFTMQSNQGSATAIPNQTTSINMASANIPPVNADTTGNAIDYEAEAKKALAAGDYKAFDAIMQLADYTDKKAAGNGGKPLSTTAAKDIANAQTGLDSIQIMQSEMQRDPNVVKKSAIPGGGAIGGLGDSLLGTSQYEAARQQVVDVIARMRTGATINDSEAKTFNAMVPKAFDPPDVAQQKLAQLSQMFQIVANRNNTGAVTAVAS